MFVGTLILLATHGLAPPATVSATSRRAGLSGTAPTSRRSALTGAATTVAGVSAAAAAAIALPMPAIATPTKECARQDLECVSARRAAAQDNLKENWGGIVGVVSLLVLRGWNRARVDAINPNSFNNAMRRKREEALKEKKRARR